MIKQGKLVRNPILQFIMADVLFAICEACRHSLKELIEVEIRRAKNVAA